MYVNQDASKKFNPNRKLKENPNRKLKETTWIDSTFKFESDPKSP